MQTIRILCLGGLLLSMTTAQAAFITINSTVEMATEWGTVQGYNSLPSGPVSIANGDHVVLNVDFQGNQNLTIGDGGNETFWPLLLAGDNNSSFTINNASVNLLGFSGVGGAASSYSLGTQSSGAAHLSPIMRDFLTAGQSVTFDGFQVSYDVQSIAVSPHSYDSLWVQAFGDNVSIGTSGAPLPTLPFVVGDLATMPGQTSFADLTGFNSDLPTIVLTHGWQIPLLTDPYDAAKTPLTELEAAIKARPDLKNPDGSYNANIMTFQWQAAHSVDPWLPRAAAESVGVKLANQLVATLGADYNGDIQLIGHSFGTVVNASAANALANAFPNKAFGVDQLTFLDAPLFDVATVIGNVVSKGTYYDLLPKGTVQYVDNFYGTTRPFAFGDKLPGAAPDNTSDLSNGGEAVPGYNHSEIQSKFYVERVQDLNGNWITVALADRYSNRPELQEWPGGESFISKVVRVSTEFAVDQWRSFVNTATEVKEYVFEVGAKTYHVVVDASKAVIKKSAEIIVTGIEIVGDVITATIDTGTDIILSTGNQIMSWLHLKESSPVVIGRELTIPDDAETLTFDYDFLNIGDGDWLTAHFDDKLLWTFLGTDFQGDGMTATISIADLAGQNGTLYLTLNSTGDRNADVLIGNIKFTSYLDTLSITRGSVPEPSSIALLIIPFVSLLFMNRRKRLSGN